MNKLCLLLVGAGTCIGSCVYADDICQSKADLVDIATINPNIKIELYFATPDNFTKKAFYNEHARAYVDRSAAEALSKVQQELEDLGIGLVVLDAYRPVSTQKALWEYCPDPDYVINPSERVGRHNCGFAVDAMLVNLSDGSLLEMSCSFFGNTCSRSYCDMPSEKAKRNCKLLELIMEKHGFTGLKTEWWHFDYKCLEDCEALDISFEELAQQTKTVN